MRSTPALLPGATFDVEELQAPDAALRAYFATVALAPPGMEAIALGSAYGRILAHDAVVREPFPAQPRSTMDGFAVRSADGGRRRRIVGSVRMGQPPPREVGPGEAMHIPTGGTLPSGADSVVPIEDADVVETTDSAAGAIDVRVTAVANAFITPAGSDMAVGEIALPAGRRIGGPEMSVLATLGLVMPIVYRRPCFAIVSTGDELVDASTQPGIGQVRDSNRWAIGGALTAMGADVLQLPNAGDELPQLRAALARALADADAVILTGGSSVGERDLTPDAIETFAGPGIVVHGLRVKPGKPTVLAAVGAKPVIGLPGNPTSALMILEAVCAPIVRALTGDVDFRPLTVRAVAEQAFSGRPGWTWFVPAQLRTAAGLVHAYPLTLRSAHTSLLARAAGYVIVGPDRSQIDAGTELDVVRFSGGGA